MSIRKKVEQFASYPQNINDLEFSEKYVELSKIYWQLADQDILLAIESAYDEILKDMAMRKDLGSFEGKTPSEIRRIFINKKIALFSQIPKEKADFIQNSIDRILKKRVVSARNCKLVIPINNEHLSVENYYYNYLLAKSAIKRLCIYKK